MFLGQTYSILDIIQVTFNCFYKMILDVSIEDVNVKLRIMFDLMSLSLEHSHFCGFCTHGAGLKTIF